LPEKGSDLHPRPLQAPPQPPPLPPQQAAPSPPSLELVVKSLTGQMIPVEGCAATDTVLAVKLWIEAAEGIPPDQQRLLMGAEQVSVHGLPWLAIASYGARFFVPWLLDKFCVCTCIRLQVKLLF